MSNFENQHQELQELYIGINSIVMVTERLMPRGESDNRANKFDGMKPAEVIKLQHALKLTADRLSEATKNLNEEYDYLRKVVVPAKMEDDDLEIAKVEGVGRVNLQSDIYASVPANRFEEFCDWLAENNSDDIIKQTVNAGTLKSFLRGRIRDGLELPEMAKVTPFTYAKITKA